MVPIVPPKDQRRRGADHPRSSPSPGRRRGCNCKKSGCLKLYCECFASNIRCGDRCQCMGCKNHEHNKLEIAHALEAIERRTQRSFKSPVAVARKLETLRTSTPQGIGRLPTTAQTQAVDQAAAPSQTPLWSAMDGATRLLMSAERLEEGTPYNTGLRINPDCICKPDACQAACSCRDNYGSCGPRCPCQRTSSVVAWPQEPIVKKSEAVLNSGSGQEKPRAPPPVHEKAKGCSCKKSNCLKLYCECLAAQRVCDARCNCEGCKNHFGNHEERERAISVILERNPMAFQPKVASGATQHLRGCNCRKSNCMKNYCECHQAGVPCTSRCACQGCRNTDAFVSAKKMLIFSSDLKVDASTSASPDGSVHSMAATGVGSSKPPRRPSRHASMDASSPSMSFQTPTGQPPSGLDMLSRTAPPATQYLQAAYYVGTSNAANTDIVTKRKLSDLLAPSEDRSFGFASDQNRKKSGKQSSSSSRSGLHERLERAASNSPVLPSVETALAEELDASRLDLPLSKLCRSLVNTAKSVDAILTPRKMDRSPMIARVAASPGPKAGESKQEPEHELVMMSPTTDDLLCQEDIETPTRPTTAASSSLTDSSASGKEEEREAKRRALELRLAALQERAVLQEFSVWLRNFTTSAASSSYPPAPQ